MRTTRRASRSGIRVRVALTVGGDAFRDQVNVVDPSGTGDLFTPNGERTVSGAFAQLRTNYSTWFEAASARRATTTTAWKAPTASAAAAATASRRRSRSASRRCSGSRVYGTYAEGYRAPAITEVFVTGAHPQPAPFDSPEQSVVCSRRSARPRKSASISGRTACSSPTTRCASRPTCIRTTSPTSSSSCRSSVWRPAQPGRAVMICTDRRFAVRSAISIRTFRRRGSGAPSSKATMTPATGSSAWRAARSKGQNLTKNRPLVKIYPAQVATTVGARFWERKVTVAVRWLAVAEKKARGHSAAAAGAGLRGPGDPDRRLQCRQPLCSTIGPMRTRFSALESITCSTSTTCSYLDLRTDTQGSNNLVPSPSPGITFKGSLKVRFGDSFFKNG